MLEQIERDLRAFADPGTPVVVDKTTAIWEQKGRSRSLSFRRAVTGELRVEPDGGEPVTYRQFLAGPDMADLQQLADFMLKVREEPHGFVETTGLWRGEEEAPQKEGHATVLIDGRATLNLPAFSTRVVLVRGEAGSGKTIALREVAQRRAERYRRGEVDQLFFYVDAQGRALARLEDAMAKDLQDLRSSFSYAAVAPLTRNQLIVPIIDGFDELLGSGGYEEAFASLAAFLSTLNGQGAVVASARSAFFDYRNFYDNAERYAKHGSVSYEVDVVEVEPWSQSQVHEYVGAIAEERQRPPGPVLQRLEELEQNLDTANRRLLSKPFYAARVADLLLAGVEISSGEALIDQLVDAFLEREHRKLLDKNQEPLLSKKGHEAFLTLLAEEMWWQESQRIDVRTVQTVAEIVAESFALPAGSARAIVERVSSYAFLSSSEGQRNALRFEHEVFYGYFLARKLLECVERERQDLKRFLNRALLDEPLGEQTARLLGEDSVRASRAVSSICSVLKPGVSSTVARENAGRLIGHIMAAADDLEDHLQFRHVIFRQIGFSGPQLRMALFYQCEFEDVDLTNAVFVEPTFEDCDLRSIIVDLNSTRLAGCSPALLEQVFSVTVDVGDTDVAAGRYFAPREIATVLKKLGVSSPPEEEVAEAPYPPQIQKKIEILDRFLRKMERRYYASEEDIAGWPFTGGKVWDEVVRKLEQHSLLAWELVDKSGPREPLVKLTVPPAIVREGENLTDMAVPTDVRQFWSDLLAQ